MTIEPRNAFLPSLLLLREHVAVPAIRLITRELLDVLPLCAIADDSVPSSLHLAVATRTAADGRPHDLCPSRCLADAFEHPTHGGIRGEVMGVCTFWLIGGAADESWLANAVPVFIDGAKRSAIPRLVSATADGQFSTTGRRNCATTRFNRQITRAMLYCTTIWLLCHRVSHGASCNIVVALLANCGNYRAGWTLDEQRRGIGFTFSDVVRELRDRRRLPRC